MHRKFINYVWINISNRFIDEFVRPIFGGVEGESKARIEFNKNMHYYIKLEDIIHIIAPDEITLEKYLASVKRAKKISKVLYNSQRRWSLIIKYVLEGWNVTRISEKLSCSRETVKSDMKRLCWVFEQVNAVHS